MVLSFPVVVRGGLKSKMKKIEHEIRKCINRFEFALLIYTSYSEQGLYDITMHLKKLLENDLINTFKKYSARASKKN